MGAGRRPREFLRRAIAQGTVWALLVVVLTPVFDQGACLGHPRGGNVESTAVPEVPAAPCLNTLDRITEHLRGLRLGQQVRVHFKNASGYFVLEDADGLVRAKDYLEAIVAIKRIWLYQP